MKRFKKFLATTLEDWSRKLADGPQPNENSSSDDVVAAIAVVKPPRNQTNWFLIAMWLIGWSVVGYFALSEGAAHFVGDTAAAGRSDAQWEHNDRDESVNAQRRRDCELALSASLALSEKRKKTDPCVTPTPSATPYLPHAR